MTVYVVIAGILAVLGFFVWFWIKAASSGAAAVTVEAQKEVIDEQAKVKAARDVMADPDSDRRERVRGQFTRR